MASEIAASNSPLALVETSMPPTPAPRHATLPAADANSETTISRPIEMDSEDSEDKANRSVPAASQPAPLPHAIRGNLTPTPPPTSSHLSSPPLTVDARSEDIRLVEKDDLALTQQRIDDATPEELRSMVTRLLPFLQDARTDAAHYRLQYQMLTIESAEAVERIQVEMDMAQRELEVLQTSEQQQRQPLAAQHPSPPRPIQDPNVRSVHVDLYSAMLQDIRDLKSHSAHQEMTIAYQKRMIIQQENEISTLNDRCKLLRERLQENRDHLNRYRRAPAGLDSTPRSERGTPYHASSVHRGAPATPSTYSREQRPFAALLHATDLMSQDSSPPAPRTPKRKRGQGPAVGSPIRPSIPATPQTLQPKTLRNVYETPQSSHHATHLKAPMSAPAARTNLFTDRAKPTSSNRNGPTRGHESDGTVSASNDSEAETEVPEHDDDLAESQASLLASQLLRTPTRPPRKERPVSGSLGPPPLPLTQTRLHGRVQKEGVQREDPGRQAKKARGGNLSGLGIQGIDEVR